jgi:integrase
MNVRMQTNLVKRGSAFYFRKKIPQDLRDHYAGRESIRKSLKNCTTQADAKREAGRLADLYEAEFAAIRNGRGAPLVPLTLEMVPGLVSAFEASSLTADDVGRGRGYTEEDFNDRRQLIADQLATVRGAYARGDLSPIREAMLDLLALVRVDPGADREALHRLARGILEARIRVLQTITRRDEGEPVATPSVTNADEIRAAWESVEPEEALSRALSVAAPADAAPRPARRSSGSRLSDVVAYWKTTSEKTHRTTSHADTLVKEFTALHGDVPLKDITKAHFVTLRDKMLTRVKPATVQARFNLLRAAFTVCLEDDQLGIIANPLQYVKIRSVEPDEKSRDAFTAGQLQTLFNSQVFTEGERPVGGRADAAFWAPLIALTTGARLDEILSLRTDGLYQHEGVWVLHFRHRPDLGQRLKGKARNNRRVPVHPELLRLGIVDYLRSVQEPGPWLFPAIDRSEKRRSHSSAWGAWFGRYLDRLGIKSDQLTFHSFRHTFKHFMRASGIPEDHHDAMTGHTTAEVARRYGSAEGYPVGALAESMGRLKFGALDLSRLHADAQ